MEVKKLTKPMKIMKILKDMNLLEVQNLIIKTINLKFTKLTKI